MAMICQRRAMRLRPMGKQAITPRIGQMRRAEISGIWAALILP
jgi:hypothetical protein